MLCFSLRFFGSNLKVLPVRSYADMAKGMLAIAKVKTVKSALDIFKAAHFVCMCVCMQRYSWGPFCRRPVSPMQTSSATGCLWLGRKSLSEVLCGRCWETFYKGDFLCRTPLRGSQEGRKFKNFLHLNFKNTHFLLHIQGSHKLNRMNPVVHGWAEGLGFRRKAALSPLRFPQCELPDSPSGQRSPRRSATPERT